MYKSGFCLRRVRTFLKKGPDTPKNFLLIWFLFYSFLRVSLCIFVAKIIRLTGIKFVVEVFLGI